MCGVCRGRGASWPAGSGSSLPNPEPGALPQWPPTLGRPLSPRGPVTWLPHSPAFPSIGVSDTPSSLHAQMWAFQLALRYRLQPLPRLGSHPQLLDPALSWGPITQLPVSSSLPTSCCHSPGPMPATLLFCVPAVSGPLKSALQNQPPDLSLLGGSRDSTWALDTRASAWGPAWAGDPCHSWASVTHRPLTAPPPGVTLTPVGEQEANKTNWEGGGPAAH